jgi:phage shock protein A
VLLRRRKELEDLVAEADAEYDEAEAERAKAESELDANEHHMADMRTAIERLTTTSSVYGTNRSRRKARCHAWSGG